MTLSNYADLTVLLADDHPLFRRGLKNVFKHLGFNGLILEAQNGGEVLNLSREQPVDLYILDYSMPILNGYETSKTLLRKNPRAKIIIMSMYNEPELITGFYEIGIRGYVDKNSEIDQIETTIIKVLNGWGVSEPVDEGCEVSLKKSIIKFTKRERELIELLAKGFTTHDISKTLNLTAKTVETYRCRLLEKVSARNTSELLHYVHRIGIV